MKTVSQLIEELKRLPGDIPVQVPVDSRQPRTGGRALTDPLINDTMASIANEPAGRLARVIILEPA